MTETERRVASTAGPKPGRLSRLTVKEQLERMAGVLSARLHTLNFGPSGTSTMLDQQARTLALMLIAEDEFTRRIAAEIITGGLLDRGDAIDPQWWGTHLGRALARTIGYTEPVVTRTTARYMLNVSRQAVDQMVSRGDLDAARGHEQPGVTRESLQRAAARRWPLASDIPDWPDQTG